MVATQMAKAKGPKKTPGDGELSSLKVRKKAQLVISKLTSLRALRSVADLFEERDVEDFFNHLLLHELQREQSNLTGKPPK